MHLQSRSLRQEGPVFEAMLGYVVRPFLKCQMSGNKEHTDFLEENLTLTLSLLSRMKFVYSF